MGGDREKNTNLYRDRETVGGEHREKYKSLQRQGDSGRGIERNKYLYRDSGRGTQREIPVSTETGRQWEGNTERNTSLYRDRETVGGEHKEKYPSLQSQRYRGRGTQREIPVSTETGRQWGNRKRYNNLYRD